MRSLCSLVHLLYSLLSHNTRCTSVPDLIFRLPHTPCSHQTSHSSCFPFVYKMSIDSRPTSVFALISRALSSLCSLFLRSLVSPVMCFSGSTHRSSTNCDYWMSWNVQSNGQAYLPERMSFGGPKLLAMNNAQNHCKNSTISIRTPGGQSVC